MNTSGSDFDATDLMLLQHPELWDNTMTTFYDVYYYGAEPPKQTYKCFVCKKMTTFVKEECCDACDAKTKAFAASLKRKNNKISFIPECDKCATVDHDGLYQICDNTEKQAVLNVCKDCKDVNEKNNFCSFCEGFFSNKDFMSERCRLCHDRILAELKAEEKADEIKRRKERRALNIRPFMK